MKLKIKTLNNKTLVIDIDDSKTVYDLKKELSLYPDVGVQPELQKLIYAGSILENETELSVYNIDVSKFIVVMLLKQSFASPSPTKPTKTTEEVKIKTPKEEPVQTAVEEKMPSTSVAAALERSANVENAAIIENIVGMGYPESEVRLALSASFNNPERAIEYLIEGMPSTAAATRNTEIGDYIEDDDEISPFEVFRNDPVFRELRNAIRGEPELVNDAIERVGQTNPALLNLITENQEDFLNMLCDDSYCDDD